MAGMTPDNQRIYGLMGQSSNDGMIARHNANVQQAMSQPRRGAQPQAPMASPGIAPTGTPSTGSQPQPSAMNYRSSINVGGGIGKSSVLSGLLNTGSQSDPNIAALARSTAWNDASQVGRGIDAQNQQLQMEQQAKRSEATTEGATNLSKIYGDYAERSNSQVALAAQIAANNIGFAGGVQSAFNPWQAARGLMR
jgi:hypothetical protein